MSGRFGGMPGIDQCRSSLDCLWISALIFREFAGDTSRAPTSTCRSGVGLFRARLWLADFHYSGRKSPLLKRHPAVEAVRLEVDRLAAEHLYVG